MDDFTFPSAKSLNHAGRFDNIYLRRSIADQLVKFSTEAERETLFDTLIVNILHLYRQVVWRTIHLVATAIVYQHFFLFKWEQQKAAVPAGAPNFWLKRIVPPVEFGLMHAILLQLAIIPVTMCKALLSMLASSQLLSRAFPFARILNFHIQLGYTFCIFIILATILFFGFFGKICSDHKEDKDPLDGCAKFQTEIMATGLAIFGLVLIILATAYFRNRIPYELFYFPHLLTLAMYGVSLMHTLRERERERERGTDRRTDRDREGGTAVLIHFEGGGWVLAYTSWEYRHCLRG